jgi:curved DNA-binding protein CbpA
MSFYKVLGVEGSAGDDEIRLAYKQAVIKAHPDKPGGTPQKFKQVQVAYETLKNKESRKEYDDKLATARKLRAFAMHRPEPLSSVKSPSLHKILDGTVYAFETAPDKLKCKFRFGDVVSFGKDTGCFVGLGSNGFYWTREGSDVAVFLCCMGSERDIELQFRANIDRAARRASSAAASSRRVERFNSFAGAAANLPPTPVSQRHDAVGLQQQRTVSPSLSSSFAVDLRQREAQRRRDVQERERLLGVASKIRKLVAEEQLARSHIRDAVMSCFAQLRELHIAFQVDVAEVYGSPSSTPKSLLSRSTLKKNSSKLEAAEPVISSAGGFQRPSFPPPPSLSPETMSESGATASSSRIPFSPVFQSASAPNLRLDRMQPIISVKKKLAVDATQTSVKEKPKSSTAVEATSSTPSGRRKSVAVSSQKSQPASLLSSAASGKTIAASSCSQLHLQRRHSLSGSFTSAPPSPTAAALSSSSKPLSCRFRPALSLANELEVSPPRGRTTTSPRRGAIRDFDSTMMEQPMRSSTPNNTHRQKMTDESDLPVRSRTPSVRAFR